MIKRVGIILSILLILSKKLPLCLSQTSSANSFRRVLRLGDEIESQNMWGQSPQHVNLQHRLVYQVLQEEHVVKVLRMWTHYA